ncbi:sensor histidine kinase [Roseixanthobacter pseudopolyaromaticivorans]|uniref:sensor histidine kinase n=1 Tax=Xanthobacteraceae TaxID=335928 RepID=UPI0037290969
MSEPHTCSLRWRLVSRLVTLQAAMLTLFIAVIFAALWATGYLVGLEPEDAVIDTLAAATAQGPDGGLELRDTPALKSLRAERPDLWFTIRDKAGHELKEGPVPPEFARAGKALDDVGQARLGWTLDEPPRAAARLKKVRTPAGSLQIMTGPGGSVPLGRIAWAAFILGISVILPALALMTLSTLVATPIVVRRSLASLSATAAEAQRIDADDRGARLSLDDVPDEVVPLVTAVNDALGRLDEGYERRQRFLMDAAHELRTPIAILNTRLEGLPDGPDKSRLLEDLARLSLLAEQLLDLQRLDRSGPFMPVDLVPLARRTVADLAPLAISAGFDLSFETEGESIAVAGEPFSLERALYNLVQNAIEHAGGGAIVVRVERGGVMEVADDGGGVPAEFRQRIFEPFQRLRPRARGAGLGLHLVGEIVRAHHGSVCVIDGPGGGARFRITLPLFATPGATVPARA